MWALLLLKVYATKHVNPVLSGDDEKTFRKWSWCFIHLIAAERILRYFMVFYDFCWITLRLIQLSCGIGLNCRSFLGCFISVYGTDCAIFEPTPFSSGWYSHEFLGPGLRYKVGITVEHGEIVWVNGLFPCEFWPDVKIFKQKNEAYVNRWRARIGWQWLSW